MMMLQPYEACLTEPDPTAAIFSFLIFFFFNSISLVILSALRNNMLYYWASIHLNCWHRVSKPG